MDFKNYNSYDFLITFDSNYNSRVAGTPEELRAGLYIKLLLEEMGYEVHRQEFPFFGKKSQNFIATKQGRSQKNKYTVVVGAHYDCVAAGFGIDDNASGVAIVLEAAKYFATHPSEFTIVFAFWGAEECGLMGSKFYVNNLGTAYPANDHEYFERKGIPYIGFESTNWEIGERDGFTQTTSVGSIWHTRKDKLEYIEKQFPGRIAKSLETFKMMLIKILNDYIYNVDKAIRAKPVFT